MLEDVQGAVQAWKDSLAEQTAAAEIAGTGRIHSMFNADDQIAAAIDDLVGAPARRAPRPSRSTSSPASKMPT